MFQEPTHVAFNGPSYVAPDKQGVCTVGEYPAKVRGSRILYSGIALGIASDSWSLGIAAAEFGAFRGLYPTTHILQESKKEEDIKVDDDAGRYVLNICPNNYRKVRLPLRTEAVAGILPGENKIIGAGVYGDIRLVFEAEDSPLYLLSGVPVGNSFLFSEKDRTKWFDNGRLDLPGLYRIKIKGAVTARNVPNSFETLPVNFSLRWKPDGAPSGSHPTTVSNADLLNVLLHRYVIRPEPNLEYAWPHLHFELTYNIQFLGEKGQFVIKNESSPYVDTVGSRKAVSIEIVRMTYTNLVQAKEAEWSSDAFINPIPSNQAPSFYQPFFAPGAFNVRLMYFPSSAAPPITE
jgi:hypothetical protein